MRSDGAPEGSGGTTNGRDRHGGDSDEELARRARAGDERAVAALFDRHLPQLRAIVRRRLPRGLRAKVSESDLVQETYLAAFVALERFEDRGGGSFARWLRGILAHKIADEVRRLESERRDVRREVRDGDAHDVRDRFPQATDTTPSTGAARGERDDAVRAVVAGLAADHRTILHLVHERGLTLSQAGREMGRSPDAARMLYARALARVAERIRRDPRSAHDD